METILTVSGMMCTHCKARVEDICSKIPGVETVAVDLMAKTVQITGNPNMEEVKSVITAAGYNVEK